MNNTNPIFEALGNLDENFAAEAIIPRKKRMKKPLKFTIIAVSAALALGTTAVAASSGEHPIMKLNYKQIPADYDEYVNEDGWTVKTLTALEPAEDMPSYRPVGRIRAYCTDGDLIFYDELGVDLIITQDTNLFGTAFKGDEKRLHSKGAYLPEYYRSRSSIPADYSSISYEEWIDPIKYVKYKSEIAQAAITSDAYPDSLDKLLAGPSNQYLYQSTPNEVYKLFGFAPLIGKDMTENEGRCFALLDYDYKKKEFTQGLYQYSLTDMASGTPIEFTVWHHADLREAFTEHYDFDYEYVELNDGTQARIHRSVTGEYIAEFEYDGAAYAFKTALDRDNVTRIMINLGILSV